MPPTLRNFINGSWTDATGSEAVPVSNPATGETIALHPMSPQADIDAAIESAAKAFRDWWMTPVPTRSAMLFRYRHLVWEARDELAEIIVRENGKTFAEAQGEMLRALQYIEHASAVTETMKGSVTENVGTGVDIEYIREPLGPFGIIAPFNFPAMIPLYFTWAVATGNPVVIKPSEHCPLTTTRLVELAVEAGFPPGVINLVFGDKTIVERLASHPDVIGLSFVGSVTDTAVIDKCLPNIISSMLGNSSQRCFAGSNLVIYDSIYDQFVERFLEGVREFRLGNGMDPATTMGPVISPASQQNLETAVDTAVEQGAQLLLDGRGATVDNHPDGNWIGPTVVTAQPGMDIFDRELFGPVRALHRASGLDEAISVVNASPYGHTAAIYTEHGGVAREFRQRAEVGQVGINIGTPAPIAFYAVGGRKTSFYGSLRGRANDAVDFYTDKKVVVSTWHIDTSQETGADPAFEGTS